METETRMVSDTGRHRNHPRSLYVNSCLKTLPKEGLENLADKILLRILQMNEANDIET